MDKQTGIWERIVSEPASDALLNVAMKRLSRALSDMIGYSIRYQRIQIETVPIAQVAMRLGDPECEMVGIYLQLYGSGHGQALFVLSMDSALTLVDLLETPRGPVPGPGIGLNERAALAELGNVALSHFCNAVVSFADTPAQIRPSPPAVVVDMQGAIASLAVMPSAATGDEVTIIETFLSDVNEALQVRFWMLPNRATRCA